MSWRVAIDIGGGFTDLLAIDDETGNVKWVKVESTPPNLEKGVIEAFSEAKLDMRDVKCIIHGQTVVINTIITRTGAKTGLVTTKSFDILDIGRGNRRDMFNLKYRKPKPFVPRSLQVGVTERIMRDGSVIALLNEDEVKCAAEKLVDQGVESIAIGFINSYINPMHEQKAGETIAKLLKEKKPIAITLSHELTREWREYERISTAVLNAYTHPKMRNYVVELENFLRETGFKEAFYLMLSNAGMATSQFVREHPILALEGGPIAGVVGGITLAEIIGDNDLIILDGGSTTTKAALIEDLTLNITTDYWVGGDKWNPGYPIKVPFVEVIEIGNGGCSVCWIDNVGNLRVGPRSAGAYPGPACYGKGGEEPTLTDAYVTNGYLNPKYLLGGKIKVHRDLAAKALNPVADHYDTSPEEVADGIIRIANDQAAQTIRLVAIQKGYDPRDYTLIAHGGSGPMFAPFIASEMQMEKVVIPSITPGVFNCWGMLAADIRHELLRTHFIELGRTPEIVDSLNRVYTDLEDEIVKIFAREGFSSDVSVLRYADMRYKGQEWYIKTPIMSGEIGREDIGKIEKEFSKAHRHSYGFILPGNPVEIVNFHVGGLVRTDKPQLKPPSKEGRSLSRALMEEREVYLGRKLGFNAVPIYERELLPMEVVIDGPAIIEEKTATIVITKDFQARNDEYSNIIMRPKSHD